MGQYCSCVGQIVADVCYPPLGRVRRSVASNYTHYNPEEVRADRSPTSLRRRRHKEANKSIFTLHGKVPEGYREHLSQEYSIQEPIGQGAFGKVFRATQKSSGMEFAIKELLLAPQFRAQPKKIMDPKRVRTEVEVMKNMDHPNIITLYEIVETSTIIYLVMELCTGGELFTEIVKRGSFTEPLATYLVRQIMLPVRYLHLKHIMHRDLKPENFLFQRPGPLIHGTLKLIDFGMSQPFLLGSGSPCRRSKVGTSFYVAPQVLRGVYDERIDVWSIGIILYIMLHGSPPFDGTNEEIVLQRVMKGVLPPFDGYISAEAQDLLRQLLMYDPTKRITMAEALKHPWMTPGTCQSAPVELPSAILRRLETFQRLGKFKQACMHVIASRSLNTDDTDIRDLHEIFQKWDVDANGVLSMQELKDGMRDAGYLDVDSETCNELLASVDIDGSGAIDYTEFLAATFDRRKFLRRDKLMMTFHLFDRDGDGRITKQELEHVLMSDKLNLGDVFREFDANKDGAIDFEEFEEIIRRSLTQCCDIPETSLTPSKPITPIISASLN